MLAISTSAWKVWKKKTVDTCHLKQTFQIYISNSADIKAMK